MKKELLDKALELAKQERGFDSVEFCCKWDNFDVYSCYFSDETEPLFIGLPLFILIDEKENIVRVATEKEFDVFADLIPDD